MILPRFRRACVVSLVCGTLSMGASLLAQSVLYGVAYPGDSAPDPATLYSINLNTGVATQIGSAGSIGFAQVGAIDFNPLNGVLYGIGLRPSDNSPVLITINTSTGVGTEIGVVATGNTFTDMSFRNDGALFAFSKTSGGTVFTVNLSSGAGTVIASEVVSGSGNAVAFSSSGTLYYGNGSFLGTIDSTTGALNPSPTSLTYPGTLTGGRTNGMDFDPVSGVLWASVSLGSSSHLASIDTLTGTVTDIGDAQARLDAVAFSPIPETSTWVLTAGFAVFGFVGWSRRRPA